MKSKVKIQAEGRGGNVHYIENGKILPFNWEFSAVGLDIDVPTPQEWDAFCIKHIAEWAKSRRQEILEQLAEEVCEQKAKNSRICIEDHWINIIF